MSELGDRMELIRATLAAALPARVVTRDLLDFAQRGEEELKKGIYTLMSADESGYENLNGRLAMDGGQKIALVAQFVVGEGTLPSAIEDAEFAMVEEIKAFVRALPPTLCRLYLKGFRQSQQLDAPYGWVAFDLEFVR